jgi:hypothetical protein
MRAWQIIDVELEEDEAAFEAQDPDGLGYVDLDGLRGALVQVCAVHRHACGSHALCDGVCVAWHEGHACTISP